MTIPKFNTIDEYRAWLGDDRRLVVIVQRAVETWYNARIRELTKKGKTPDEIQAMIDSRELLPPGRMPESAGDSLFKKYAEMSPADKEAFDKKLCYGVEGVALLDVYKGLSSDERANFDQAMIAHRKAMIKK